MLFNIRPARERNTTNLYNNSIWRVFIDGVLFISNDKRTCFDTADEANSALSNSEWMTELNRYIDYSQKFFNKINDNTWRENFTQKVLNHVNIEFKEYKWEEKIN